MKIVWNAPEGRFFDAGLDRGVLYPKTPPPPGEIVATNLIRNGSFETDMSGWTQYVNGVTGTVTTTVQVVPTSFGTKGVRVTATGLGGASANRVGIQSELTAARPQVGYNATAVFGPSIDPFEKFNIRVEYYNAASALIGSASLTSLNGVTGRLVAPFTTPALTAFVKLQVYKSGGLGTSPANFWIDAVSLHEGTAPDYFDGDTPDTADWEYAWTGTPRLSTSTKKTKLTNVVPWMGLQSVDEEGGEGAAAYYVDGRPFLFLPRPKEYKATLKAITYPDAFSEIMGIHEVADGMYLDSQPGNTFDLSYRTLVGNAVDGVDHGYKIHLVYNCSVSPQAMTYESLSDSINPTSFSWEIQAVPVQVEGFRPTAHIIIDTRHMSQSKVNALEDMIYGSETTLPAMPTPQAVFDLLSYGDTIIVTDNGDGTFDVVGSYENVYMIGDGVFQVDNVDGQDNGDGTFTISTTLE